MTAINTNKDSTESVAGNTELKNSGSSATYTPETTVTYGPETTSIGEQDTEIENKEAHMGMGLGPTSFAELEKVRIEAKKNLSIKQLLSDFMTLAGNVLTFPSEKGVALDVKNLLKEMDDLIPEEEAEEEAEGAEEETKESTTTNENNADAQQERKNPMFMIWKDDETGEYRWLGVYSNKFRDDDSPAEILAEKAHVRFIDRVEKGELDYPDLYVWHIPVPVGRADLLAYDDAGFSVASGTIKEDFALALLNSSEDLAMSHGMPAQHIRRDDVDKTVITDYVSTELSILPRYAAANKMTDFYVLEEEEAKMAIIPDEKRQQVTALLGEELAEKLETSLAERNQKALAEGLEFKEKEVEADSAAEEAETTADTEGAVDEGPTAEADSESVDSDAGVTGQEEEPVEEGEVLKGEIAETLSTIVEAFGNQNKQVVEAIERMDRRVADLEKNLGTLNKSDEEKVAELAASTPEASLQALVAKHLASARAESVIGKEAAYVHGNSKLAKEGPEEAPHNEEETKEGYTGLFFRNW